jgi:hypothetical protein
MLKVLIGIAAGALLGFLYYRFVGCATGTCPITRNPYTSTLYGAFLGAVVAIGVQ